MVSSADTAARTLNTLTERIRNSSIWTSVRFLQGRLHAFAFQRGQTVLEAAGAALDDVVSCLVHLVDLADLPAFNAVYERKFTGVKPVRTTVRADLVAGLLVEITVVARAS